MRYGRILNPIAASLVDTPQTGITEFVDAATMLLSGKFPDGSVRPLIPGTTGPFLPVAVNEGDANDLVFTVAGVVAYTQGDTYSFYLTEDNTLGNMTININGLGAQAVKFLGNADLDIPVGAMKGANAHYFIYNNGRFEWLGVVMGNQVMLEAAIGFADIQGIGVTATENLDIALPGGALIDAVVANATVDFAGGAATAVDVTMTETASTYDLFGAAVDLFTGAVAAQKGGMSNGIRTAGVIPDQTRGGRQVYRMAFAVTTDTWANIASGAMNFQLHWGLAPW